MPLPYMNMHTPHHTISKKAGGTRCTPRLTKAPSVTLVDTFLNMTKNII
jgi:hypothetical protein